MKPDGSARKARRWVPPLRWLTAVLAVACLAGAPDRLAAAPEATPGFAETVRILASFGDRSTGTQGNAQAAEFIKQELTRLRLGPVETHQFQVPVVRYGESTLHIPNRRLNIPIHPLAGNAITPQTIAPPELPAL